MSTLSTTNLKNPSASGNNIVLATDGSATIATLSSTTITGTTIQGTIKSGTAVASTSGTSIDFTSIPSWVKRITVMLQGVSGNGASHNLLQLGTSSGVTTSGYVCSYGYFGAPFSTTAGFGVYAGAAGEVVHGNAIITNLTGNTWVFSYSGGVSGTSTLGAGGGGSIALGATLDRVRLTHVNGTDTFDAGSINILYEG
jgi:hypothetical protein